MDATRRCFLTTAVTAVGVAATRKLADPDDHEHGHNREAVQSDVTMISTRLTERFGIRHPIVCAPMAYVTGGAPAAAVSRAGGLGIVGGGYAGTLGGEPDLETELARAKSSKFGVGFITWALERAPKALTNALQHSPFCVFLSFGDPRPFAAEIREAGAVLICQVQFLSQIDMALEAGAAAVVVQGTEAGGHGANRSTFAFVPEAADYLKRRSPKTLLIAAGGVADGRGLAAALLLGADGAVVGTRLWASAEALTQRLIRTRLSARPATRPFGRKSSMRCAAFLGQGDIHIAS